MKLAATTVAVIPAVISLGSNPAAASEPPPEPEFDAVMERERLLDDESKETAEDPEDLNEVPGRPVATPGEATFEEMLAEARAGLGCDVGARDALFNPSVDECDALSGLRSQYELTLDDIAAQFGAEQ